MFSAPTDQQRVKNYGATTAVNPDGAGHALHYRPDIDGLRAIAVISVVLFHLSHAWLPGGFLGVDVFFVISGFLITTILVRESSQGQFSIIRFYERRVRRIAPALLLLLAVVTIVASALLLPLDLTGFAKSVLATIGFVSNVYFWRDGNYFARAAEDKPLLHTWTLGVEEQFYILFPLLVAVLARRPRSLLYAVVAIITVGSLLSNVLALRIGAALPAFYLLPTRAWELGAGALLALTPYRTLSVRNAGILSAVGLVLILLGLTIGPSALPVEIPVASPAVFGAVLLIWAGGCAANPVGSVLAWRPAVWIGLISYSLYLWHWPVIVLYRYYTIADVSVVAALILVPIMVALAAFSWWFVERPFRTKLFSRRQVFSFAAIGAFAVAAASVGLIASGGLPGRLDPAAAKLNQAVSSHFHCPISSFVAFGSRSGCMMSSGTPDQADVVLLGNSHAQMYAPLVADLASSRGLKTLLVPANRCAPLIGLNVTRNCLRIAEKNIDAVAAQKMARTVILAFQWRITDKLIDRSGRIPADPKRALMAGLDQTIARLRRSGKQVVLVGPIEGPTYDYPSIASRAAAFHRDPGLPDHATQADFDKEMGPYIAHYSAMAGIVLIRPDLEQCSRGICRFQLDGESLFADDNHLAEGALRFFRPQFEQQLNHVFASHLQASEKH